MNLSLLSVQRALWIPSSSKRFVRILSTSLWYTIRNGNCNLKREAMAILLRFLKTVSFSDNWCKIVIWGGLIQNDHNQINYLFSILKIECLNTGHLNSAPISREITIIPLNGADGLVTNHFHHSQQSASLLPNGILSV